MCSIKQFSSGLIKFIDTEMLPALPVNQHWIVGAVVFAIQNKIPEIIEGFVKNPTVEIMGIIDKKGNIDLDSLTNVVKQTCQKYGSYNLKIPVLGEFKFNEADFNMLLELIKMEV